MIHDKCYIEFDEDNPGIIFITSMFGDICHLWLDEYGLYNMSIYYHDAIVGIDDNIIPEIVGVDDV